MSKSKDTGNLNPCSIHSECFHNENCDRSMCLLFFQPTITFEDLKDAVREWLKHDKLLTLHRAMPKVPFGPREPLCPKCAEHRQGKYDYYNPNCPDCGTDIDCFVLANRHLFKTTLVYTVISKVVFIALKGVLDE